MAGEGAGLALDVSSESEGSHEPCEAPTWSDLVSTHSCAGNRTSNRVAHIRTTRETPSRGMGISKNQGPQYRPRIAVLL